jgi:pyruvate kinase
MCDRKSHNESFVNDIREFEIRMCDSLSFPRTSILATIGPSSFNQVKVSAKRPRIDLVEQMANLGMNLIRINLAHVQDDDDRENIKLLLDRIAQIKHLVKRPIAVSVDLAGPKFRIGDFKPTDIEQGTEFVLTLDPNFGVTPGTFGTPQRCSLDVEKNFLIHNIRIGQQVLIDDGFFSLVVEKVTNTEIYCRTINPWRLLPHKGVNFPGTVLTESVLTDKDVDDLRWLFDPEVGIARNGQIDYVSLSFVKSASEIHNLRANLNFLHQQQVKVVAKIETEEAVDLRNNYREFDRILEAADAIMVARGDLGAEIGIVNVPEVQSELIRRARDKRRPSIVATQMLESMTKNRFPTRAEVTDVSNAIREGADVIMLSGETSAGIDPVAVVAMMANIARRAESCVKPESEKVLHCTGDGFTEAIGHPIIEWAANIHARLIIVYTTSGYTAEVISRYRPTQPIIAITHSYDAMMELSLYWGVYSILINYVPQSAEEAKLIASTVIERLELANADDTMMMTMSMGKLGIPESHDTNTIHVFKYEPSLLAGIGIPDNVK